MATWARVSAVASAAIAAGVLWAAPAGADVVEPPGSCQGTGTWEGSGQFEDSAAHERSDVIEIPQEDTVDWTGSLEGHAIGDTVPRREIDGAVEVKLPAPVGWVTIDDWGGSSERVANEGSHHYKLPSVLIGIELPLRGFHNENGVGFCEGEVSVVVEGSTFSNPMAIAGLAGLAIFGGVLYFAGRPVITKAGPSYEDVNPG